MGLTPADFVNFVHDMDVKPIAYGAHSGVGAPDLAVTITQLAAAARSGDVIVAKGNCGIPFYEEGHIRYNGTPELMAEYARVVRDAGAKIVGGCCGTSPEHLSALRAALESHQPGSMPTIDSIVTRLGPLTSKLSATLGAEAPAGRRSRRRANGADSHPDF
jgi:hypothetical protein